MEIKCVSLGGAIVSKEDGVNVEYIKKLHELLREYKNKYKFIIAVGGGYGARLYISSTRKVIGNNSLLDQIAIAITRINALIVKDLILDLNVYPNVATSLEELKMAIGTYNVVLIGGLIPGLTTDSVAVLACEVTNSKEVLNVSTGSYVFDRPPYQKGAKKLNSLTHDQLVDIAYKYDERIAGTNFIFDLVASKLAKRAKLTIRFVNDDISQLKLALEGKKHNGSVVK